MADRTIKAGALSEGASKLVNHALRADGSAACSSYLDVSLTASNAGDIPAALRCKRRACRELFAEADAPTATGPAQGDGEVENG